MDWSILITPVASFVGAGLAARLAVKSFYKEKVWERKVDAYTAIFAALHEINRWYETHYEANLVDREIPDDETAKLQELYSEAKRKLRQRLDSEIWLVPKDCRDLLDGMDKKMGVRFESFFEMLDNNAFVTRKAIEDLRDMVRVDLELDRASWWARIKVQAAKLLSSPSGTENTIP